MVSNKNTKGLSKHEHTVSNCEFFITAGIGCTFYSPLKLGSPYFSAPKLNLMRCKNVNFFIPFIIFSLITLIQHSITIILKKTVFNKRDIVIFINNIINDFIFFMLFILNSKFYSRNFSNLFFNNF